MSGRHGNFGRRAGAAAATPAAPTPLVRIGLRGDRFLLGCGFVLCGGFLLSGRFSLDGW